MSSLFRQIWCCDFEFSAPDGELPKPICMVARELNSGRLVRLWADEFGPQAPFPVHADALFVAYYASAELGCFLPLGWQLPVRILDLFCEFRQITNGSRTLAGNGLLWALVHFGLSGIDAAEKKEMRDLAVRGAPFTDEEKTTLLDYCQTDVDALAKLLPVMLPKIDIPRALLRGRYMASVAHMERNGILMDDNYISRLTTTEFPDPV